MTDLNGDGKSDLITASNITNKISVRLGLGDGSFANISTYDVGIAPNNVTLADVNGDGKSDVLTANYSSNNISVLLGKGDGSFAIQSTYLMGTRPIGLALADLNNDGNVDVVTSNNDNDKFSIRLGTGDGSFATETSYSSKGYASASIVLTDLNHDSKTDLIKTNSGNSNISVLFGQGDGHFDIANETTYLMGNSPGGIVLADLNGDSNKDVIVDNVYGNTISVRLGQSNGSFLAETTYATGTNPGANIAVIDVDGDNKLDAIVPNLTDNTVSVLLGNGDGSFQNQRTYPTNGDRTTSLAVSDLNNDGAMDIATSNRDSKNISVLLNTSPIITHASLTITDTPLNTPPTLAANTITNFTEQTPIPINNALTLNDPDGDFDWNGGSLKLQITANNTANDSLSLPTANNNGIWLNPTGNVLMNNTTAIGTADAASVSNGSLWTITFNAAATNALVQETARAIQFTNNSDAPGTTARTVTFTATDNNGGTGSTTQTINITAVNDVPTGAVSIIGIAQQGETLTAANTLTDSDGLGTITGKPMALTLA